MTISLCVYICLFIFVTIRKISRHFSNLVWLYISHLVSVFWFVVFRSGCQKDEDRSVWGQL